MHVNWGQIFYLKDSLHKASWVDHIRRWRSQFMDDVCVRPASSKIYIWMDLPRDVVDLLKDGRNHFEKFDSLKREQSEVHRLSNLH